MPKLITASCFMLFWVFYEMSGGADFAPRERTVISKSPFAPIEEQQTVSLVADDTSLVTNVAFNTLEPVAEPPVAPTIPEPQQVAALAEIEEPAFVMVYVTGTRVNLRDGPGTNHPILDTVVQGTAAELVASNDNGWAQIRLSEGGQIGWIAARLLSDS